MARSVTPALSTLQDSDSLLRPGDHSSDELDEWPRFIDRCQMLVGRYQLDDTEDSSVVVSMLAAASRLRSRAGRLMAHSVILQLARDLDPALYGILSVGGADGADGTGEPKTDSSVAPSSTDPTSRGHLDFRVRAVLEHVSSASLQHRLRLADLAMSLRISPSYLSRLVVRQTGMTFNRHLLLARMEQSARLLEKSNLSIKEIGSAVGYEHVPSFDRQFRQYFHLTPTEFRRHAK